MNKKTFTLLVIIFVVMIFIIRQNKVSLNLPEGIPDLEIVFMPFNSHPVHINEEANTLGFIDKDGNGQVEFRFPIVGGSQDMLGRRRITYIANWPRWSNDGESIMFYVRDSGSYVRIIERNGAIYGEDCYLFTSASSIFDKSGNLLAVITEHAPVFNEYKNIISEEQSLIARYSLKECQILGVLNLPVSSNFFLYGISESKLGYIVGMYYDIEIKSSMILVYNSKNNAIERFAGYNSSLSDDGKLLAYINIEGKLTIRELTTKQEKILEVDLFPKLKLDPSLIGRIGWSPDGEWIVFNNANGEIFKLNILTKEKVFLTNGWMPDWR